MRIWVGLVMTLGACAAEDPATTTTNDNLFTGSCGSTWCSANSPVIDHYGFWELNLDHRRNAQGWTLIGASQNGQFYDLDVAQSTISFLDVHGHPMTGAALWGATIWLLHGKQQYGVTLEAVGEIEDVIIGDRLPTYIFDWSPVVSQPLLHIMHAGDIAEVPVTSGATEHVCSSAAPIQGSPNEWDELTTMVPYQSVVFEGDRFHPNYTVDPVANDRWFNIGCDHDELAKMRMTRNTLHTVKSHDWRQVQATLKFLAADYCGQGTAYTVTGTPIVWRNDVGMTYKSVPHIGQLEARWDQDGALCLETPRLAMYPDPNFPNVEQSIYDECKAVGHPLPPCDPDPNKPGGELITSANH